MAGTATVVVTPTVYITLGTGPMYISPEGEIMIAVGAGQPAATVLGHPLGESPVPFSFTLAEVVWAISLQGNTVNVVVTT